MDDYRAFVSEVTQLDNDLLRGLDFIGWKDHVRADSRVFVKPNFTFFRHRPGITTTPALLRELLGILKDRAECVIVGESDGGNRSFTADDAFSGHDMYRIARETGADLVNLSKSESICMKDKVLNKTVRIQLPRLLVEDVDCFISVPVLKVHAMTKVTLGIKNIWGCWPDTMRCLYHEDLAHRLALMTRVLKPKITVIDGIYALNNHGPMYGKPLKTDLLIASNNVVVADSLGSKVMGMDPKRINHISIPEKIGLGTTDLKKVRMNADWENHRRNFRIRRTLIDHLSTIMFESESVSRLVMDSRLTPLIYAFAGLLRNREESSLAEELGGKK